MKVLIINTLYYPYRIGGAEISVQTIAEGLQKKGYDVMVVTLGETNESILINKVPVVRFRFQNLFWPFDHLKRSKLARLRWHFNDRHNKNYDKFFNKVISEFKPDIIHTHNLTGFSVAIWDIAQKHRIKIVHTLRDYYLQCPRTCKFKNGKACLESCTECYLLSQNKRKSSQKVDAVIGLSASILDSHVSRGYFLSSIQRVVYNGFNIPEDFPVRKKFTTQSDLKLGYIGRIDPSKGIDYLVETLSKFSEMNNWKLYIAGNTSEEYRNKLASLLPEDKIQFLGYTDQEVFLKKIDILIVPTLCEESFGRVVIEALLSTVVVIGSRKGGITELLSNNKKFTFNPTNQELYELLDKILKNPEELHTFNFDEDWLKNEFSIKMMIERHIESYNEVLLTK